MKRLLYLLLVCLPLQAQGLYLVLTPKQFKIAETWLNAENGWPDGNGTVRYCEPFAFSQSSNCPLVLQDKVGLVLDKAMIRHIAAAVPGETRADKLERIVRLARTNLSNPTVLRVVAEGSDAERQTATFTDVTASVVDRVRALVN